MKNFLKWLHKFISPLAIGIYLTLIITLVTFKFLESRLNTDESTSSGFMNALNMAHLKSIDLRFLSRGYRKGSNQVALIAIDDKSVEIEGRWPWPRQAWWP